MSHSLRAKIKGLRYKGIITDKDCDRLCKALDNEGVLDKLRAELHATAEMHDDGDYYLRDEWIDEYFDEYKAESEQQEGEDK